MTLFDLDRMETCPLCRRPNRWLYQVIGALDKLTILCGKCAQREAALESRRSEYEIPDDGTAR